MNLFKHLPSLKLLDLHYLLLYLFLLAEHRLEVILHQLELMNHQLSLILLR